MVLEKPIYVVGDIHGRYDEFCCLLKNVVPLVSSGTVKLVCLGDYSGYGRYSLRVMEYLYDLKSKYPKEVVLLAGNWEDMLMGALFHGNTAFEDVLRSRGAMPFVMWLRDHPKSLEFVKKFLDILDLAYTEGCYVFSHAGVDDDAFLCTNGDDAIRNSSVDSLLWQWDFFDKNKDRDGATLKYIVGHVPIQILSERIYGEKNPAPKPVFSNNIIVADFGSSRNKGFLGYILLNPDGSRKFKVVPVVPISKKKK